MGGIDQRVSKRGDWEKKVDRLFPSRVEPQLTLDKLSQILSRSAMMVARRFSIGVEPI